MADEARDKEWPQLADCLGSATTEGRGPVATGSAADNCHANLIFISGCSAVGSALALGACRAFNVLKNKKPQNPCIHAGFGHL